MPKAKRIGITPNPRKAYSGPGMTVFGATTDIATRVFSHGLVSLGFVYI